MGDDVDECDSDGADGTRSQNADVSSEVQAENGLDESPIALSPIRRWSPQHRRRRWSFIPRSMNKLKLRPTRRPKYKTCENTNKSKNINYSIEADPTRRTFLSVDRSLQHDVLISWTLLMDSFFASRSTEGIQYESLLCREYRRSYQVVSVALNFYAS